MKKCLLLISVLFFGSFILCSCGDESYSKANDSKKVMFLAETTTTAQNADNNSNS